MNTDVLLVFVCLFVILLFLHFKSCPEPSVQILLSFFVILTFIAQGVEGVIIN